MKENLQQTEKEPHWDLRAISWERREIELLAALAREFLHTSVEPKYCFSSYIVTIKTELEEWCQSPVTSTVMHWTILPEGTCARAGSATRLWLLGRFREAPSLQNPEIALERKHFIRAQGSSETRMIHWAWIWEFISFNVPCEWRDCIAPDLFYKRGIKEKNLCFSVASAGFSSRWDQWELVDL